MCVCVCVCVSVCVFVCLCVSVCVCAWVHAHARTHAPNHREYLPGDAKQLSFNEAKLLMTCSKHKEKQIVCSIARTWIGNAGE